MNLVSELKRRRVFRAAGLYLVGAWAVIQVADVVGPRVGLADWAVTLVIVVAAVGLPIALVLAWLYEFTAAGIERTATSDASASAPGISPTRATGLIGLGMVISLVVFGAYWRLQSPDSGRNDDVTSLAVLPFVDMSPNKDQEYFGDGITEEILNVLAQLPGLRVPARTSSFSFKGKNLPIGEVARQLKVAHVLEGSVRKSGDQVRITAQLIDASNDRRIWSDTYDRKLSDVFAVQDEIAHAIVNALQLRMGSRKELVEKETSNGRAHELYLKGLYHWNRRHIEELPLALDEFRAAASEDPKYARAYAGIALTYVVLPQYVKFDRNEASREGKAAAVKALQLDPRAADAHAALSQIALTIDWDWKAAEAHADTAVALDPTYATGHQWRAEVYNTLGRNDDALREINRALDLDPLSSVIQNVRAGILERAGRYQEASELYHSILDHDPSFEPPRLNLLALSLITQNYDEALKFTAGHAAAASLVAALKDPSKVPAMLATLGDPSTRAEVPALSLAYVYLLLGQRDSAAALVNRGADTRERGLEGAVHDPIFAPIRQHPQFLRKLHL